jgi:hypothetical protein
VEIEEIKVCVVGGWAEGILEASVNDETKRETVLRFRHVNYHHRPIEYTVDNLVMVGMVFWWIIVTNPV